VGDGLARVPHLRISRVSPIQRRSPSPRGARGGETGVAPGRWRYSVADMTAVSVIGAPEQAGKNSVTRSPQVAAS
jgi:hypothetical protein